VRRWWWVGRWCSVVGSAYHQCAPPLPCAGMLTHNRLRHHNEHHQFLRFDLRLDNMFTTATNRSEKGRREGAHEPRHVGTNSNRANTPAHALVDYGAPRKDQNVVGDRFSQTVWKITRGVPYKASAECRIEKRRVVHFLPGNRRHPTFSPIARIDHSRCSALHFFSSKTRFA